MKRDHEIFDHWWDYFVVAWWGFSTPNDQELLQRKNKAQDDVAHEYLSRVTSLVKSKKSTNIKAFEDFVEKKIDEENDRKGLIESKAHSLLGQTGITVTLLIGSLSFGAMQAVAWPQEVKIVAWAFFLLAGFHFIVAGLHARNAVTLVRGYSHESEEDLLDPKVEKSTILIGGMYRAEYNSYFNDAKATYLKIAHWYFKSGLLTIFLAILVLPPLLYFNTKSVANNNPIAGTCVARCACPGDTNSGHWMCECISRRKLVNDLKLRDSVADPSISRTPSIPNESAYPKTRR